MGFPSIFSVLYYYPIKQGLKPNLELRIFVISKNVLYYHPIKQGLKFLYNCFILSSVKSIVAMASLLSIFILRFIVDTL